MNKKIFTTGIALLSLLAYSQNRMEIDYTIIKAKVLDSKSESYYPKLLKRFEKFDTTLSLEDKALIYYGFSFQNDYIKNKPDELKLDELIKSEDFAQAAIECEKILKKNPVSLIANDRMGYALFKLGKPEEEWRKFQNRYRDFRKVIALSGNGLTCETGFKIIYVSDEYNMLFSYFEIPKIGKQSLVGLCDQFEVEQSQYYKSNLMYFDASRSLIRNQEIIDGK